MSRRNRLRLLLTFAIMVLVSSSVHAITYDDLFAPPYRLYGINSVTITSGDFNGDGKLDIASGNYPQGITILIGDGNGIFQSGGNYTTGYFPVGIAAGDFNNDGMIDLVTANRDGYSISVLLGNGDGTFQAHVDNSASYPNNVSVGDLNSDGKLDIVTPNWYPGTVTVFLGNGDGTFGSADYPSGEYDLDIEIADFNNDGKLDLATANLHSGSVSILIGNGDGTFQANRDYSVGGAPFSVTTGDLNNDGCVDIISSNWVDTVSVLLGKGDGTFTPYVNYSTGYYPWSITAGDFDSNGKLDIVTTTRTGVSILLGNGNGTLQPKILYSIGAYPGSIIATDFNNDKKVDLAMGFFGGVSILLNIYNRPPVANASADQIIECRGPGTLAKLDGSNSSDPDGDPLTYTWSWNGGSAEGVNPTVQLPLGTTEVTLTVSDGKATAMDTVSITVQDTTPPVTTATGGNEDWFSTNVISTFTASDSCSGVREVHYFMNGSETVTPGGYATATFTADGIYNISYFAVDNAGNAEAPKPLTVRIDKTPPVVSINTNPGILWPPDHKIVDVFVGGDATDVLSGLASVVFTVRDEYGTVQPSLSGFNTTMPLEAWREGTDKDGRRYTITATATDAAGNKSAATTEVLVPHDQR